MKQLGKGGQVFWEAGDAEPTAPFVADLGMRIARVQSAGQNREAARVNVTELDADNQQFLAGAANSEINVTAFSDEGMGTQTGAIQNIDVGDNGFIVVRPGGTGSGLREYGFQGQCSNRTEPEVDNETARTIQFTFVATGAHTDQNQA